MAIDKTFFIRSIPLKKIKVDPIDPYITYYDDNDWQSHYIDIIPIKNSINSYPSNFIREYDFTALDKKIDHQQQKKSRKKKNN